MTTTNKPTIGFWMIAVIAFIWNLMGAYMYIIQKYKTESFESQYTSMQLDMIYSMPAWATAAFAIAVFGGVLGSVTLLMRRKIATSIYFLSLIGIIVQMIYNIFISAAIEVYGPGAIVMPIMVLAIGVFLYTYSKKSSIKGWLN